MRLTIGLPVFNGDAFLEQTVRALLVQTFGDFELLISDNASTDHTEMIGRKFAAMDPRVRYRRNDTNIGLARNFNQVFESSSGALFKWATSDDLCLPGYLEGCITTLDQSPDAVLAYPKTRFIDAAGADLDVTDPGWDLQDPAPEARLAFVFTAGHWVNSVLGVIRRSALAKTRLMPAYPGGDYALLGELALQGTFRETSDIHFCRRLHRGATSQHATDPGWLANYFRGAARTNRHPGWRRHLDHARTIIHSDLPAATKLLLFKALMAAMRRRRRQLWLELRGAR